MQGAGASFRLVNEKWQEAGASGPGESRMSGLSGGIRAGRAWVDLTTLEPKINPASWSTGSGGGKPGIILPG